MRLEEHFESSSTLQRNERVKLAASFWNNVGAGMVIGGIAAAFFLDKPPGAWTKIGIAIAGLLLGWLCYSIASFRRLPSNSGPPPNRPFPSEVPHEARAVRQAR
jgi:MFS family permease